MKRTVLIGALAATMALGAPALAQNANANAAASMKSNNMSAEGEANMNARAKVATKTNASMKMRVVEKNNRGRVSKVEYDGEVYPVCMGDDNDNCINPREAGLKWGNRPLGYWPGQPASER